MFKDTLKYYMWGYQQHFRWCLEYEANKIFHMLTDRLDPKAFLVGLLCETSPGSHPICIEPEECGISVDALALSANLLDRFAHPDLRKSRTGLTPPLRAV